MQVPGQCFGQNVYSLKDAETGCARFSIDLLPLKGATSRAGCARFSIALLPLKGHRPHRTCTETGSATLHMRLADRFPFEAGRRPALRESCEPSDRAMPSRRYVFSGCCLVWAVKRAWSSYAPAHRWRKKVTIKDSVQSCRLCPKRRQCGQKRLGQIV